MSFPSFKCCLTISAVAMSLLMAAAPSAFAQAKCTGSGDLFLQPFNKNSAQNRPIGSGARYADQSHPATRSWMQAKTFAVNVGGPWGADVVQVTGTDPKVTIAGTGSKIGLPATVRVPKAGLDTRVGYNAFGTTDGVAIIFDQTTGVAHEFFQYKWNNAKPTASIHRPVNLRGLGHGTSRGQRIGVTAAGPSTMMGLLRGDTINDSNQKIEHALQIVLPRLKGTSNVMLSREVRLPATTTDGNATASGNNLGNIPYGALLALPPSVDIGRLGLSGPGFRLAEAIRNYGIYVVDGGGPAIRADQNVSSQVLSQLRADIPKIYPHIRMVLNNDLMGTAAAGGGQPLAPNCAFDSVVTKAAAGKPSSESSGSSSNDIPSASQSVNTPPSSKQSAGNSGSNSDSSGSGNLSGPPAANTQAGTDWAMAQDFYQRSVWNKRAMDRSRPGTSDYAMHERNYIRTIEGYIEYARRAGAVVDRDTPPDEARW